MSESIKEKLNGLFTDDIDQNIKLFKDITGDNTDLVQREFIFLESVKIRAVCFYTDGLTSTSEVDKVINTLLYKAKEMMLAINGGVISSLFVENLKEKVIVNPSITIETKFEAAIDGFLSGDTVLIIDGSEKVFVISTRGWDTRSVDEPQTEQVVRGPRDGFTENLRTNTALVRRRIRDPLLRIEAMKIGRKSKTDINIAYLEGTVKEGLVEEVKRRLKTIQIDAIMDSGYVEELIEDAPYSPFTTIQSTERPDKVAASIVEGKIAIFVDNSPFVLIVPSYFWQFLQASDDYYSRYMSGSFFRIIRYIAFIISLTLPSLYVMLVSFHQEMIPTALALTIASGREVVPFPVLLEALIMELAFELMREAGLRMPKPVGQAVSIVGSLVIGQAAVQAGVVSPFMVIVVAITGISSFAIPNYAASFSIRLIRFPLLIASGTLGLLGFAAMFTIIAIHAMSLRSFGESYLAPATPFQPTDQKDSIIRLPWWKMDRQPQLAEGEEFRSGKHQRPTPPDKGGTGELKEEDTSKKKLTPHKKGNNEKKESPSNMKNDSTFLEKKVTNSNKEDESNTNININTFVTPEENESTISEKNTYQESKTPLITIRRKASKKQRSGKDET